VGDHPATVTLSGPHPPGTVEPPTDLRLIECPRVLDYVTAAFGTGLDLERVRRKRRTVSAPTTRGTWLRLEVRAEHGVRVQGWGGIEAAATLTGIAKPDWYRSISWRDSHHGVWWRADETELVDDPVVAGCATVGVDPGLPAGWWASLRSSLTALAAAPSWRPAKLHGATASQDYLRVLVGRATTGLGIGPVDSTIDQWASAHADLTWANLTAGPAGCTVLDWEDWGAAPRGFDAATLLLNSLAVPTLAARVRDEFAEDLTSRSGRVAVLALCADLLAYPDFAGSLLAPARAEALSAAESLRR
jgi:hypothetical protein